MSNLYADLSTTKTRLGITGTADDAALLVLLEHVSRAIDGFCNRWFFVRTETRSYDGGRSPLLLDGDLVAVTSLKTDDDGDGTPEATWAATDYELLPYNGSPKAAVAVTSWGARRHFLPGQRRAVQVAGRWGYEESTVRSGATTNEAVPPLSATDSTLTVSDGTKIKVGETLLVESEQLYVSAISANDLTVARGVNGTTAASHANGLDVSVYRYPKAVTEACMVLAGRAWRRKDLQFVVNPTERPGAWSRPLVDLDPEARALLLPYRRQPVVAV